MNSEDDFVDKIEFNRYMKTMIQKRGRMDKPIWTKKRIQETIKIVERYKLAPELKIARTTNQYYYAKKYDVIYLGNKKGLISLKKSLSGETVEIVPAEEYYNILTNVHKTSGHGGRDKIKRILKNKYFIPVPIITTFLKQCKVCQSKKVSPKKQISVHQTAESNIFKKNVPNEFQHRGQVGFIDLQKTPDGPYKWLLYYEDCKSKFCFLRPLTTIRVSEIAKELLKIFLEIGFPIILQSKTGREFTAAIIEEIASIWPSSKIVNGKPQMAIANDSNGQSVEEKLRAWLADNNTTNWSFACSIIQFQKNSSIDSVLKKTPFQALFGVEPLTGLQTLDIPTDLLNNIVTEEDLEAAICVNSVESFETVKDVKMEEEFAIFSSDSSQEIKPSTSELHLQEILVDSTSTNSSPNI